MGQKENSERLRELKILETLEQEPELRQVDLAARLELAIGTVNWLIKRLSAKGYVKVKHIGQWRWRYILTPQGFAQKVKLTQSFVRNSMLLYRETWQQASELLGKLREQGYHQVRLEGAPGNDLVDVCRLTCIEQGVKVVGSGESGEPRTTSHVLQAIHHEPRTTSHDDVPALHVDGQELFLKWPKEGNG